MTVRLALIAHAATRATREARFPDDEPLDTHGTEAAAVAAGTLRRVTAAYRGPEERCRQTAAALGLDAATAPALADLNAGTWRGRTLTEVEAGQPADLYAWLSDPHAAPHDGESLSELIARVVAITHPAIIRAAVLHTLGAPPECFWRLDVTPLSQTWLTRHDGRWQLRETGHPLTPPSTGR